MTTAANDTNNMLKSVINYIAGALLVIVMAVVGYQNAQMDKMENRIYALQRDAVTDDKLKDTEARINENIKLQIGLITDKIEITNTQIDRLVQLIQEDRKNRR